MAIYTSSTNQKISKLGFWPIFSTFLTFGLIAAMILAVGLVRQNQVSKQAASAPQFPSDSSMASGLSLATTPALGQLSQIDFNGRVKVNGALILSASETPNNPSTGELYYDHKTGNVAYYNGEEFKVLATNTSSVTNVGGLQGSITLGSGLTTQNGRLVLTNPNTTSTTAQTNTPVPTNYVANLQGQVGSLVLMPGTGIAITTNTIGTGNTANTNLSFTNTGVTQIGNLAGALLTGRGIITTGNVISSNTSFTAGSADLAVTDDGIGNYSIAVTGSGLSGTLTLAPPTPQDDASTSSSISINKTNTGNLAQFQVNNVDKFQIDPTGNITIGTIYYNQVTGRPTNMVEVLGGASGTISLGTGLTVIGNVLSSTNSGITAINGTTDQVTASTVNGITTLSLPQNLATTSSPTFSVLNLTNALPVASGGTNANNAAQAKTNLGIASSGTNSDITALTNLTNITPIASLTIGSTNQSLTLQGSTTTITQTNGINTSTLSFTTPTTNNSIIIPDTSGTICLSSGNCLGGSGGGASTSLNNLSNVAINTSLTPGITTIDLGSSIKPFRDIYLGSTTTNNFRLTGAATSSQVITFPNVTGTVCLTTGNCAGAGNGIIGTGTQNTIAMFTGTSNIANAMLTQDAGATTLTVTGNLTVTNNVYGIGTNLTNLDTAKITTGTVAVAYGGTGLTTTPLNGQLLIGNTTTNGYTLANLTPGANISIDTSVPGNITINAIYPAQGANTSLSNLSNVAINSNILPGASGIVLGSSTLPFNALNLGNGSNNITLNATNSTTTRTIALPNESGTICLQSPACNFSGASGNANYIQNQYAVAQDNSTFWISGTARGDSGILTPNLDTATAAALNITNTTATSLDISNATATTTIAGTLTATSTNITLGTITASELVNNGATINTTKAINNLATGGSIGTANTTVDVYTAITINQTTAGQTITIPNPTNTTTGRVIYISNIGTVNFTLGGATFPFGATAVYVWNGSAWVPAPAGGTSFTTVGAIKTSVASSFAAKVDYATGTAPYYVTTGDVNNDGKPDVITANYTSSTASVFINNGNGTFAAKVDYATGTNPSSITTSDINGDGKQDLITGNYGAASVSVLVNNGNGTFATKVDYTVGINLFSVSSADVNNDDKPDILTANYGSTTASVLLNNGNGTFATKVDYITGSSPYGVTTADVNGDTKIDMITSNWGANTVSVFINNGNGTFAAKIDYNVGLSPETVVSTDLNNDGKPDIAVVNTGGVNFSVLMNNGNGTFATKTDYTTGTNPADISIADVNGDAKPDILIANYASNTASVFINNGNGTFATKVDYTTGSNPDSLTRADVNSDGKVDIVVSNRTSSTISVLINTATYKSPDAAILSGANINFQTVDAGASGLVSTGTQYIQGAKSFTSLLTASASATFQGGAVSLNTDSNTDTNINTGTSTGAVTIGGSNLLVKNTTDSTTAFAVKTASDATVLGVDTTNQAVNINGSATYIDGSSNVITAALSTTIIDPAKAGLILQAASGQAVDILRVQDSTSAALFNVNRLGFVGIGVDVPTQQLDINGTMNSNSDLYVGNTLRIDSAGNFLNIHDLNVIGNTSLIKPTVDSTNTFTIQDASSTNLLNIDTTNSIITVGTAGTSQFINNASTINATLELPDFPTGGSIGTPSTTVDVYTNININQTTPNQTLTIPDPTNTTPGRTLYVTNTGTTPFTLLGNPIPANTSANLIWDGTTWIIGTITNAGVNAVGAINVGVQFSVKVDYATGTSPYSVASADVNGDNKPDIITSNQSSSTISVFFGNGDGTFATKADYTTGSTPYGVTTADVNGDNNPDIMVANVGPSTVSVFLNNGNGTFAAKVDYNTALHPGDVAAGDLNGDGKTDIIVANMDAASVSVFLNNGNGTFAAKVDYTTGISPESIAIVDINNDLKLDIITANRNSNTVSALINNGNGTFAAKVDYTTGTNPEIVITADVNNDAKPDILVSNNAAASISVLMNNGNGTFATKVDYATGSGPRGFSVADINNDSNLDVIISSGSVYVLLNNGNGTFADKLGFTVGSNPYDAVVLDLDGDSRQDIIAANYSSSTVSVLINKTILKSSNAAKLSGVNISLQLADPASSGLMSTAAQSIQGQKTFSGLLTATAGATFQAGDINLNTDSNNDTNINTGTSTGAVTIGGSQLLVKNTSDSTSAFTVKTASNATVLGVDTTNQAVNINGSATYIDGSSNVITAALSTTIIDPAKAGLILQAASGQAVDILRVQDSTSAALFNVNRLGFIGIGVDVPTQQLDINGTMNSNSDLYVGNTLRIDSAGSFLNIRDLNVIGNTSLIKPTVDSTNTFTVQDASSTNLLNIDTTNSTITIGTPGNSQFINNAATTNTTLELPDFPTGGSIGNATTTVDVYTNINITQTTPSQTLTLPDPTNTAPGRTIYITNTGTTPFTLLANPIPANTGTNVLWDGAGWKIATISNSGVNQSASPNTFTQSFAAKSDVATGLTPRGITTADVNTDGKPDMLTSNSAANTASVFISNGNGTFATKVDYTTGAGPYNITAADVNADSKPDMLVANYTSSTTSVFINNGNGTFATKVDYTTGTNPYSLTTADVNSDGKNDILVPNFGSNTVSVLLNNGNGTFATKIDYATGTWPFGIASADLNADGVPDMVVSNFGGSGVSVLINNGNGTFATKVDYATGAMPQIIVGVDVNNDSKPDIMTANYSTNNASVLINNGNGTFATKVDYSTGANPYSVGAADVNLDGNQDMLVVNFNSNNVSVLLNNGNGTFASKVDYTTGTNPYGVTAADVNSDGKPDILTANYTANSISIILNSATAAASTDAAYISGKSIGLQVTNAAYSGIISLAAQSIQGQKTLTGLLTASAGATFQGGEVNLNVDSNNSTNINTGTSTGTVTFGGNTAVLKPTTDSASVIKIQNASALDLMSVDSTTATITMASLTVSTSLTLNNGHVLTAGTTPTKTDGPASCTTPTITLEGNDTIGSISITTGSGCSVNGVLATINFNTAFASAPKYIKFTATNANAAKLKYYNATRTTANFTLDTDTTPTDTTIYTYNYSVLQ